MDRLKTKYFIPQVSYLDPKGEGSSYKIGRFLSNSNSNFRQDDFLDHAPVNLENQISFRDV